MHTPISALSRRAALALSVSLLAVNAEARSAADQRFEALVQRYLQGFARLSPISATELGDHRFDHEVDDMSAQGRARRSEFCESLLADLARIPAKQLSRDNQVDRAMLENKLRFDLWEEQSLQTWAWDAQIYSGAAGSALYALMARDFAPLKTRLRAAHARMKKLPGLLAQARTSLQPSRVPKVHAETVAKQNAGLMSIVDDLILPEIKILPALEQEQIKAAAETLRAAALEHQIWLDTVLVPKAQGNFRLGAKVYDQKLRFALMSDLSRADIRARADDALKLAREEMYQVSKGVLAGKPQAPELPEKPSAKQQQAAIEAALELVYADRPARGDLVETSKQGLALATEFVRKHDLITLPTAPVEIILMPEFQRGFSVAYCSPPGPLERHLPTFYAVSPIPDEWTDAQATSFLREYNRLGIYDIAVHEAMPGHFVQLWHSNKNKSVIRALLWSGTFVEGWAVYAEDMMADAGFMDNDPLFRLQQLKTRIRTITNAILDQMIHVDGADRDTVMKFLTTTAFQQEREAAGKWTRACLSSTQLPSYFVGVAEHDETRAEAEKRWGKSFSLKRYHDKVLSHGSPPMRFARALLFGEPIKA